MKTPLQSAIISLCILAVLGCGSAAHKTGQPAYSADSLTIDAAISEAASYFTQHLPQGAKVALVHFDAPSGRLSDYIFEELWSRFEDSRHYIMIDRRNLGRIETEINIQYDSGRVDDNAIVSITKQYGAEILVYGQMSPLGNEYRITIYATDVEKATSRQRAVTVRPDNRLTALLTVTPDEEVERAVSVMAQAVNQVTVVAVGRIGYADTQTVTSLSAWLKNGIITGAQKHRDKFQVATESESSDFAVASRGLTKDTPIVDSPVQAVITGSYSPLDNGAEVSLQLLSASGNKAVLASQRFTISAAELDRRKLSLLPEKDGAVITKTEFESKQQAVDPYAGKNNKWDFTVTPNVLDGIYYDGDFMTLRIYSARDCYFRIVQVDVNGNAQIIYPLLTNDNNFIRAGETRRIPDNAYYRMGTPFGEEMILTAAYDRPFKINKQTGSSLSVESVLRTLMVESDNNSTISPLATAKFSYTVLPR